MNNVVIVLEFRYFIFKNNNLYYVHWPARYIGNFGTSTFAWLLNGTTRYFLYTVGN